MPKSEMEELIQQDVEAVRAVMSHDPFAQMEEQEGEEQIEEQAGEEQAGEEQEASSDGQEQAGEEQEQEQEATQPQAAATEPNVELELLRQSNETLRQQLAQQGRPAQDEGKSQEENIPAYMFDLPENVVNAIYAEDLTTRRQAINALLHNLGQSVHRNLREEYRSYYQNETPRHIAASAKETEEMKSIESDFYGTYKEWNNPTMKRFVTSVASEVLQENPGARWGPTVKKIIGDRVKQRLAEIGAGSGQQQQPQQGEAEQKKQSSSSNGSRKPAHQQRRTVRPALKQVASETADIADTLFGRD